MSGVKKVVRKVVPQSALTSAEEKYRLAKAKTAYRVYGKASKDAKVIAVTGTNGKTTTCAFINAMLKGAGLKTAVYTTAFTEINGRYSPNKSHMTVASAWSVQKFFKQAKKAGADWVVLEVTSHSLDQYRIFNVPVEVAVVTNLSQEHLDYHKTMENYAFAKARLITEYKPKYTVLNADDEWFEYFGRKVKKNLISVGRHHATHQIKNVALKANGTDFKVISPKGQCDISMKLVGDFNVYNAAQAVAVGQAIGLSSKDIAKGINELPVVAGRLEPVDAGQDFTVLVDYAHTPDAIKNVLKAAKSVATGEVRIVFGATGVGEYARDTTKRGPMGEVAAKYADFVYLTDDETYLEDPDSIRDAVEQGILKAGGKDKYVEIGDRRQAIKQAFKDAVKGDVVLLCGIGHQDYRAMGGKKEPWDERQVAKKILLEIRC
jgi:UDP-N-acetylmuramoyl-L-alanyl-D-glutamate--2,6-diaminopimelate ligase